MRFHRAEGQPRLVWSVVLGWSVFVIALLSATIVGELVEARLGASTFYAPGCQGVGNVGFCGTGYSRPSARWG